MKTIQTRHDISFHMECNRSFLLKLEKGEKVDHTKFMVLDLQLYDVYQEYILGFSVKKRWQVNASHW
jgi:hypothetical protein